MSVSTDLLKPLIAGGVAIAADQFYLKQTDITKSLTFAGSVAAGIYAGTLIGNMAPDLQLPVLGSGKGLESRILEVGAGGGATYAVNKYILKNAVYKDEMIQRLGVILVCDLTAELACDFLAGRPLSIFS